MSSEPERWFSAVELTDAYACLVPQDQIKARQQQRKRHGSSSTERAAVSTIIGGVIYTGIKRGQFERRKTPDGRLLVRAARSVAA